MPGTSFGSLVLVYRFAGDLNGNLSSSIPASGLNFRSLCNMTVIDFLRSPRKDPYFPVTPLWSPALGIQLELKQVARFSLV